MKRILIVEDSPTQAQQLEDLLLADYAVTVARSGEEAIELLDGGEFDLVVSDIMMPGINGYELCRRIKRREELAELPVVLLTSLSDPMDIVRGLEAGADNYITKPYDPAQLRARIRRVVDQRSLRRNQRTSMGVNISFLGSTFSITSEKEQILDVLLSAVEDTVRANRLLEEQQRALAEAHARLEVSARESARAARISEERARALMQNAADAIFLLDSHGAVLEVNAEAASLLGREPEAIVYRSITEFVAANGGDRLHRILERVRQEGEASVEATLIDRDVVLDLSASVTRLDDEEFTLLIARDVTERRRDEERLRRSERLFAEAQQIAAVGSWELDLGSGTFRTSTEMDRIFGFRLGDAPDWSAALLEAVVPADRDVVAGMIEQAIEHGGPIDIEYGIVDGRGRARVIHARGTQVEADGQKRLRGTVQDVTERREVERRVVESEQTLRTLIDAAPMAIITLDADARIRSWNHAAETVFGWTAQEVLGEPLPFVPPTELDVSRALNGRIMSGESIVNVELNRVRRDGAHIDLSFSGAPLRDASGTVVGLVALLSDITDQKRAAEALHNSEEQLRHAQRMEAIGRLTGGIAHDFNNMLTAIQGGTQLLLMDHASNKGLCEELREIDRAASRAADLTRQLLAFSRKQPMQPQVLDLNALIGHMNRMLTRLIGEQVELRTSLQPDLHTILADPGQMEQIIMNLVVNARDAMPDGGELEIQTRDVSEVLEEGGAACPCVALSIRDTGTGIHPDVVARMFDPFFTTKPAGLGTGLGLSTVYGIVKQNSGTVRVDSEPGAGATFTILMPAASDAEEPDEAGSAAVAVADDEGSRGSETVLLVEDEPGVRKLAGRILRRNGYMVLEASDGPEALELAAEFPGAIHVIVTDVVMPGMTGPELVDRLSETRPDLRVLFISGYADDAVRARSDAGRRIALLAKPFTAEDFGARLRELIDEG